MAADPISLPTRLATRLVFDSVSYSNCLPPWRDDVDMDFADMDRHIRRRISEYLKGRNPSAPFTILVPKRNGSKKKWVIPSVMDQVILQTAVSELARPVSTLLDEKRVFSYRINKNPNKVQFTENQAASWTLFQETTQSRLKGPASSMLQMDLEGAFHSIDRPRFYDFLKRVSPSGIEVKLVEHLVESFAGHDPGLPLINDSLFFLGNAYLAVVDQVIQKQTPSFIRFVDDYRIFGSSNDGLERRFEQIDRALGDLGFKINMSKVKVGTRNDYFQAIANVRFTRNKDRIDYISPAVFNDVIEPEKLVSLVERVINQPDEFMNEGLGRLLLGAVRRMRLSDDVQVNKRNYLNSPQIKFEEALASRSELLARAQGLLDQYAADRSESWRAVWIAYVFASAGLSPNNDSADPVIRYWADRAPRGPFGSRHSSLLSDLNYLEEGASSNG